MWWKKLVPTVKQTTGFTAVLGYLLPLLHRHEQLYLFAYPDPASPMGQALGHKGIVKIGQTGVVPKHVEHLTGNPWTVGWGQTGKDVKPGTRWTKLQADERLYLTILDLYRQLNDIWPHSYDLPAPVQAALVSLIYNRGTSLEKRPNDALDRRREMRSLGPAIAKKDYHEIIRLLESMKRLWVGKNLDGLIARRDAEINLCRLALEQP